MTLANSQNRKLKILHLIETADPKFGGPVEMSRTLANYLYQNGHQHDLVTLDPPGTLPAPGYPGRLYAMGPRFGRSLKELYRYSPPIKAWLEENAPKYDAVIISGLWRYQTRAAAQVLAKGDVPYVVFTHGMLDPWFRRRYPWKHVLKQVSWWLSEGPTLRHARRVVFTCEEEGVLADKAFWPYHVNGVSLGYGTADVPDDPQAQKAAFRDALPQLDGRRHLLYLSRIHPKKGCDLLIRGFAEYAASQPGLDLVIAGPDQVGLVKSLRALAKKLGVGDRVHFPGMLSGAVKFGAYRSAEAFILPSHQENFGIVVAEALACSVPVLISNKVNIWREVEADGAGLVEPDTVQGAKDLIGRFLALREAEVVEMGRRARASFENRFKTEVFAARLVELIHSIT